MEQKIKKKIIKYHKKINKKANNFYFSFRLNKVKCVFFNKKSSTIAFFDEVDGLISYNLYHKGLINGYKEIIKHEFAHVIDYVNRGHTFLNKRGNKYIYHGKSWKDACKLLKMKKISRYYDFE